MYKCENCGTLFSEGDISCNRHSVELVEEIEVCPECGGDCFSEINICKCCGEESEYDLCEECIDDKTTPDVVWEYGENEKEKVSLNALLVMQFSESEIEEILLRELTEANQFRDAMEDLINSDKYDYVDYLVERGL